MRLVLSTIGKFHTFDLARELHARGMLETVFTGYPRFKLRREALPPASIRSYPWVHTPYMAFPRREWLGPRVLQAWEYLDKRTLDAHVSRHLPACDVFVGLSGSALLSGRAARAAGARYVCDRGSSHIRVQDQLLREEYALWGMPCDGIDPRVMALEEAEYAEADCITVPSSFARRTYLQQGIAAERLRLLPYGVDLARFHPTAAPDPARFDVVFVGGMRLIKGIPYLLQAYRHLRHPGKSLTFAGDVSPALMARMRALGLWPDDIRVLGHVAQHQLKDLLSRSHAMVLSSVEDGFGMVMAQAMACACPVVASRHTGAEDLYDDGVEGYIVPVRDADALAQRLQQLADDPDLRAHMGQAALERVRRVGGWTEYGDTAVAIYRRLLA